MATKRVDDEPPVHDGTFTFDPHMVVQDNSDDTVVHETHIEQFRKHIQQELEAFPVYQFAKAYAAQCGDPIHKHVQPNRVPDVGSVGDVLEAAEDAAERFVYRFCVQGIKKTQQGVEGEGEAEEEEDEDGAGGAAAGGATPGGGIGGGVGDAADVTQSGGGAATTTTPAAAADAVGGALDSTATADANTPPATPRRFGNVNTPQDFARFLFSNTTALYRANAAVLNPQKKVWQNGGPIDLSQIVLGKDYGKFFPSIARTYRRKRDEYRRELTKHKAQSVVDMMIDWDLHKHLDFVLAPATANALQLAWTNLGQTRITLEQCLDDPTARLLLAEYAAVQRRRKHYVAEHTQRHLNGQKWRARNLLLRCLGKTLKRKRTRLQSQRDFERAVKRATT